MRDAATFGTWLRHERERRGLSLEAIASRTKVAASVLGGLERGDLSRWPLGIFRRAFVRAYAESIGLDPTEVLREFLLIYPEDGVGSTIVARAFAGAVAPGTLRLTLAEGPGPAGPPWQRLVAVGLDLAAAATMAMLLGQHWPAFQWPALAGGLFAYVAVGVLAAGTTPGAWLARTVAHAWERRRRDADVQRGAQLEAEAVDYLIAQTRSRPGSRRGRVLPRGDRPGGPGVDPRVTRH